MSYIDRKTAIEKLRGYKVNVTSILSEADTIAAAIDDGIDAAISVLSTMPDADVESIRHGEWITVTDEIFADRHYCSACMNYAEVDLYGEEILSKYCLNCGAKMEETEDV